MATASSWHGSAGDEMKCKRRSRKTQEPVLSSAYCCHLLVFNAVSIGTRCNRGHVPDKWNGDTGF